MIGWTEALAGLATLGPVISGWLGHRRAAKTAARTSQVLRYARDAAYFVASMVKNDQAADAARIIDEWSRKFALMMSAAGLDLSEAQEDEALDEARHVFGKLGQAAAGVAADRLTVASIQLSCTLAALRPTLARMKREDDAAKAAYAKRMADKKKADAASKKAP